MSIQVDRLHFSYRSKQVLTDITFSVEEPSLLCLLGPNGVGKSTLFRCMLGLLTGYSGSITAEGHHIRKLAPAQLARLVAYVPQSHSPAFSYSVQDMVLMGTASHFSLMSSPGRKERGLADEAMERLGILHLRERSFLELSGGERQLVLIARALAQQARILFMDEPTANLDYGNQLRVLQRVKELTRDGYTVIQSTHNPDQALLFADQVLAMKDGRVFAWGTPGEVMNGELLKELYGVDIALEQLYGGAVSVCIPGFAVPAGAVGDGKRKLAGVSG